MKKFALFFALVALFVEGAMADVVVIPPQAYAGKPFQIALGGHLWDDMTYNMVPIGTVTDSTWSIGPDISVQYSFSESFALETFLDASALDLQTETTEGSISIAKINYQAGLVAKLCGSSDRFWGFIPSAGCGIEYFDISGKYLVNPDRWSFLWSLGLDVPIDDTFGVSFEYRIPWNMEFDANPPNIRVPWTTGDFSTRFAGEPMIRILMRP